MKRWLALVGVLMSCAPAPRPQPAAVVVALEQKNAATTPPARDEPGAALRWAKMRRRQVDASVFLCRLLADGRAGCWDFKDGDYVLLAVPGLSSISATLNSPNGRTEDNRIVTWDGYDAPVTTLYRDVLMMAAGMDSVCLLHEDGTVGTTDMVQGPDNKVAGLTDVVYVAGSGFPYGAINAAGQVSVFLGGTMLGREVQAEPMSIPLPGPAVHLELSFDQGCAVVAEQPTPQPGKVYCWSKSAGAPQRVLVPDAVKVAVANHHACALTAAGQVWCWGRNANGRLGQGHSEPLEEPVQVKLPISATDITTNDSFGGTCAVDRDSTYCWGENFGATAKQRRAPIRVFARTEDEDEDDELLFDDD